MTPPTPKPPKSKVYYVATKDGHICASSKRKKDIIAWKRAFGASMWKATTTFKRFEDDGKDL